MESGLRVSLDPLGGNEVNIRAVLRAAVLKWGGPRTAGDTDGAIDADSGSEDVGASDDDAPTEKTTTVPRRQVANDYDYDDDFIDDDQLIVEDEQDVATTGTPDPRHQTHAVAAAPEDEPVLFPADAPLERDEALPVVHPVDPAFYVNRGDIRSRPRIESAQKKARARMRSSRRRDADPEPSTPVAKTGKTGKPTGKPLPAPVKTTGKAGKAVSRLKSPASKQNDGDMDGKSAKGKKAGAVGTQKRALKQQALTPQGKLAKLASPTPSSGGGASCASAPVTAASAVAAAAASAGSGESALKKRKTESGQTDKSVNGKALSKAVTDEVDSLRDTCVRLFGEKKPRLGDGDVQLRLHALFVAALKCGCAKLYSDLIKDNRRVVFADELWTLLSKFLRTTRVYLENLGHALHWGNAEQLATDAVVKAEGEVTTAVQSAPADADWNGGDFGQPIDEALWTYFRAKSELQEAKNQLASRARSVKKSMPIWASTLKKGVFAKLDGVSEELLLDVMKRIEDGKAKEAKRKRDEEKEARKKRKEEKGGDKKGETKKTPDAKKTGDGALPKKMAEALPAALRNLASLKARAGPASASSGSTAATGSASKRGEKDEEPEFEVIEID